MKPLKFLKFNAFRAYLLTNPGSNKDATKENHVIDNEIATVNVLTPFHYSMHFTHTKVTWGQLIGLHVEYNRARETSVNELRRERKCVGICLE